MKKILFGAFLLLGISTSSQAQLLKDLSQKVLKDKALPVGNLLKKPAPITTSFEDVNLQGSKPEDFGNEKTYKPLSGLKRSENGGYILQPGYYEIFNKSYCLKAGTHGPSQGDGYMFAPTKGPKDNIVNSILRNSARHTEIPQHEVQVLLWAIIAKSKFADMTGRLKATAALLLTPQEILELNGGAIGTLSDAALKKEIIHMPAAVQQVMEAENKIRGLVASGVDRFEDYEQWAILAGAAPNDRPDVKRGMWSLHPDGYYVRYMPQGYQRTTVQLYVPDALKDANVVYDAVGDIACPANTGAQRLAQTNEPLKQ
ncbi:hypothetical protein V9K67_25645 [Paraflavisolibacter sp. H34]|uniref:hypothetical protein n=1 Tax=Huijunlia imazamoxiresistens TaxID=3127457 RepID=UPI00301987ED